VIFLPKLQYVPSRHIYTRLVYKFWWARWDFMFLMNVVITMHHHACTLETSMERQGEYTLSQSWPCKWLSHQCWKLLCHADAALPSSSIPNKLPLSVWVCLPSEHHLNTFHGKWHLLLLQKLFKSINCAIFPLLSKTVVWIECIGWKSIVLLFAVLLYALHDDDDHDCLMEMVAMAPLVILKIQLWWSRVLLAFTFYKNRKFRGWPLAATSSSNSRPPLDLDWKPWHPLLRLYQQQQQQQQQRFQPTSQYHLLSQKPWQILSCRHHHNQ